MEPGYDQCLNLDGETRSMEEEVLFICDLGECQGKVHFTLAPEEDLVEI